MGMEASALSQGQVTLWLFFHLPVWGDHGDQLLKHCFSIQQEGELTSLPPVGLVPHPIGVAGEMQLL